MNRTRTFQLLTGVVLALLLHLQAQAQNLRLADIKTTTDVGLAAPLNVNSLLPIVNNQSIGNATIDELLYWPLIWIGNKIEIRWHKSLARSIQVSHHDTTYTISIHHWKWSNGRAITAADVAYSFDLIQAFGTRYLNYDIGGIPQMVRSVTVTSPDQLVIRTTRPVNPDWFELNGLSQLMALPRFSWRHDSINYLFAHQTDPTLARIVDGPYQVRHYIIGRKVVLVQNPRFSGPPALFHKLVYAMYTSSEGAFWALRSGTLDIGNVPHALFRARHLLHHLRSCITDGGFTLNYVVINYANPHASFFRQLPVRRALQYAINESLIIRIAFNGTGTPAFNPVPGDPPTYLSPLIRHLDAHPDLMYRPAHARALLRRAGWRTVPGDGWIRRNAQGHPLVFTMLLPSISRTQVVMADILKQEWRAIGVEMHIRKLPFNLMLAKLVERGGTWESAFLAWDYEPDYYPTGEGLFNTGGGTNYGHYSNPELNRLILATNLKPGRKALYAYERFALRHLPVLYIPLQGNIVYYAPSLSLAETNSTLYHVACTLPHPVIRHGIPPLVVHP